jgi:hypothetical protein
MKLDISKEECLRLAHLESNSEIGAGILARDPVVFPPRPAAPTYKLMMHDNQFGFGVSLTQYDEAGELRNGFVMNTFDTRGERQKYIAELAEFTGYEIETL